MTFKATDKQQEIFYGILLYALAVMMIVAMNSFAKIATSVHSPVEVVFYRNLVALSVIFAFVGLKRDISLLQTQRPKAHILRGLVGTLSVILVFYAHKHLPVADATALMYAAPLVIAALSMPLLGEHVGPYRWAAIACGFVGVLIMVRPEGGGDMTGYIYALAAAFTIAGVSLCLRDLGKTENPVTTVFYFILIGTIVTGCMMPFIGTLPSKEMLWPLFIVGAAGTAQQFLKTKALSLAPAATLSPLQFTGLVWGVIFGWLFFADWPDMKIWIGSLIIVGSNLFILWRERRRGHAGKNITAA